VTTVGQEAIQSFGELSGKKSSQPIDGSSKLILSLRDFRERSNADFGETPLGASLDKRGHLLAHVVELQEQ
jgi:hypothetical protein